jgi:hypothetical protein
LPWITSGAFLALVVLAGPADAGFVATFNNASPALNLRVVFDPDGGSTNNAILNATVQVGQYNWTVAGGDAPTWLAPNFWTFCIEVSDTFASPVTFNPDQLENAPQQGSGAGNGETTFNGAMGGNKADRIREFWGRHFHGGFTNLQAAAFQLGLWEIIFDNDGVPAGLDSNGRPDFLGTGDLRLGLSDTTHTNARLLANQWLGAVDGSGPREYGLVALVSYDPNNPNGSNSEQDQIVVRPVPEPTSLMLSAVGLAGFAGVAWRRRVRKTAA